MKPEKSSNEPLISSAEIKDAKKVSVWFAVPIVLAATTALLDCSLDEVEQFNIVHKTREKAELLAKTPCEVDSFSPRKRFELPSKRGVEYECGKEVVICDPKLPGGEYVCKQLSFRERMRRKLEALRKSGKELRELLEK